MEEGIVRRRRKARMQHKARGAEEDHRYLQKCSMDSGTNLVETASMVLTWLIF